MVQINKKFQKLYTTDKRYILVTGGRGSGKTFAVQDFLNTPTIKGWNNLHLLIRKDFGEGNGWSKDVEKAIVESNGDDVLFCMTFESLPIVGLLKSYYL